jgi:multidrug resistance efflux pump
MALLEKVFDTLAGRMRQRTATAHERIEVAAKAIARGENVDVAGLEDALFTVGMTLDDFRGLADLFVARAERLRTLDGLGAARKKAERIDKELEAANAAHAEAVEQYRKRYLALRDQASAAQADVDRARDCREWLLAPEHCPPSLRADYDTALAQEQAAIEAVAAAERTIRELRAEIKGEEGWLEQLAGEDAKEIYPPEVVVSKSGRDRLTAQRSAKYEEHETRKKRLERRLAEAEPELEKARAGLVAAEAAVAEVRKRIIAA